MLLFTGGILGKIIFAILAFGVHADANFLTNFMYTRFQQVQNENVKSARTIPVAQIIATPSGYTPQTVNNCSRFFGPLRQKSTIRVEYFVGYADDYRDKVRDGDEVSALRAFLLTPCFDDKKDRLCGFRGIPNVINLYFKDIVWYDQSTKRIEINLRNSSISDSDRSNRQNPEQIAKSKLVRNEFIQAIKSGDLIMYSGHSRFGGGPDFSPVLYKNHAEFKEDTSYYLKNKLGLNDMLTALAAREQSPWLIFMGSCDSRNHFAKPFSLAKNAPVNTILADDSVDESQSQKAGLRILDLLVNQKCPESFNSYLNPYTFN